MVQSGIQRIGWLDAFRLPLPMRKVGLIIAGTVAFIFAAAAVNVIGVVVKGLIPGPKEDAPGYLEPSPEEQAKKEHAANTTKTEQTSTQTQTETKPEPKEEPTKQPAQTTAPAPQPVEAPAPPPPPKAATGPGNFDAPVYYPPAGPTGPGNM